MSESKKRVKKDKFNNFTIPPRNTTTYSKTVKHIYDMIHEAAPQLLERADVRDAFNTFVEFLKKYNDASMEANRRVTLEEHLNQTSELKRKIEELSLNHKQELERNLLLLQVIKLL